MRPASIRTRLTVRWTVSFGLLLAVANVAIFAGTRAFLLRDLDAQLRTLAATELASAVDEYQGVHLHDFPADSLSAREYADKFVQLLGVDGRVLMQSVVLGAAPPLVPPPLIAEAVGGRAPIFHVTALGRPGRMTVLSTTKQGTTYLVAVGLFTDRLERTLTRLAWLLAAVWLVALALTALLGFALAGQALAPVHRITRRAAAIAHGDFSVRLDAPTVEDEIGHMTRLLNEMLERLHAAIQANRRFAADASHELRGPLTAMLGEIDVTLKRDRSAAEYRETLALVRERLDELTGLADSLMILVRAQEGHSGALGEVPLLPLLESAVARVAPIASARGITIAIDPLPHLVAYAEPSLLARVLDNIVRNAVQYNREGGTVSISGGYAPPKPGAWDAGMVELRVHDTGCGIAAEDQTRIFERFYRTDRSRSRRTGGTGLGLAICREVMTMLRGSIAVAESSAAGTTIEIRLPGALGSVPAGDSPAVAHV